MFLRDPKERFVSGVNTYIQHLTKVHNQLDIDTILFFVDNYLFLNRHYCPQFFWLINLARYINPNTKLTFCDYRDISKLTWRNSSADVLPITQELRDKINKFNWKQLELYFFLDQILIDSIGKSMTITDIFDNTKSNHPELHKLIFNKHKNIIDALS